MKYGALAVRFFVQCLSMPTRLEVARELVGMSPVLRAGRKISAARDSTAGSSSGSTVTVLMLGRSAETVEAVVCVAHAPRSSGGWMNVDRSPIRLYHFEVGVAACCA